MELTIIAFLYGFVILFDFIPLVKKRQKGDLDLCCFPVSQPLCHDSKKYGYEHAVSCKVYYKNHRNGFK